MSVWKNSVYRDNAFQNAVRLFGINGDSVEFLTKLLDFDVEEFGDFPVPNSIVAGNLRSQVPNELYAQMSFLRNLSVRVGNRRMAHFAKTFGSVKHVYTGLPAVFRVYARCHGQARALDNFMQEDVHFVRSLYLGGTYIGKHTPRDADAQFQKIIKDYSKYAAYMTRSFRAIVRVANSFNMRGYKPDVLDAISNKLAPVPLQSQEARMLRFDAVYPFQGLLILQKGDQLFVLTRDDTDRLERLLVGGGMADVYYSSYSRMSVDHRTQVMSAYRKYRDLLVARMRTISYADAQLLCRACDVAHFIVLARFGADTTDWSIRDQYDKVAKEGLNKIVDPVYLADLVAEMPIKDALEVSLFYKILPQADFDYFGAANRQKELYKTQNAITDPGLFRLVMRHHKLLMIQAYHARHGVCPGRVMYEGELPRWAQNYPFVNPANIAVLDVDVIDFAGQFAFNEHLLDNWDLVKDKAICPKDVNDLPDQMALIKLPKRDKNQLLDYVNRPEPLSTTHLRDKFDHLQVDVKCDDKAEAKKPFGRWFMEANTDYRMLLSEYELSISDYAKHLEGFMQGKGLVEKQKMMNHVTETRAELDGLTQFFISFDVAKWSPRMPFQVHVELDKMWAEAFGLPHIEHMHRIFSDGNMHYIKGRIHHVLPKSGSDFEGFAGKKLTMYHLAVMHAAVDVLREEKLVLGTARYAAQIDDGVMRVVVDFSKVPDVAQRIRTEIAKLWLACGIELSFDKTFMSKYFVVFLNDVRFYNRAIASGIRAFIKISNRGEAITANIVDDMLMAESTVRGAIVSGSTPMIAYFMYCLQVMDILRKWGPKVQKYYDRHVCWLFAPVNLGGLGMANLLRMLGSLDFDSIQSGLGNMFVLANTYPGLKPVITEILNQEMQEMTEHTQVMNPTNVKRKGRIFRTDRVTFALRNALAYWFDSPVLRAYSFSKGVELGVSAFPTLVKHGRLPVEMRELWTESSPIVAVDAIVTKVLTARTAQEFVPRRTLYRICVANVFEARQVIAAW